MEFKSILVISNHVGGQRAFGAIFGGNIILEQRLLHRLAVARFLRCSDLYLITTQRPPEMQTFRR